MHYVLHPYNTENVEVEQNFKENDIFNYLTNKQYERLCARLIKLTQSLSLLDHSYILIVIY